MAQNDTENKKKHSEKVEELKSIITSMRSEQSLMESQFKHDREELCRINSEALE
jgi:hypothetical protein